MTEDLKDGLSLIAESIQNAISDGYWLERGFVPARNPSLHPDNIRKTPTSGPDRRTNANAIQPFALDYSIMRRRSVRNHIRIEHRFEDAPVIHIPADYDGVVP